MAEVIPIRVKITPEDVEKTSRKVKAEIRQIERQAEKSGREISKDLGRGFDGLLTKLKSATVQITKFGLAAAAAATGVSLLVRESIDFADTIAKTSAVVGVSVEELQQLRFAAEQSGVETRSLDVGLQRFSRRIGEAAKGTGELRKIFEEYNIELRDSRGAIRPTIDILRDYADAIQRAGDEQTKLFLTFRGFDREGARLINLLRGGSAAINAYIAQANEFGLVIREDLARGSEIAADQINILSKAFRAAFTTAVLENIEGITAAVNGLIRVVGLLGKALSAVNNIAKDLEVTEEQVVQRLREAQGLVVRKPMPPGQEETPLLPGADLPGTTTPTRPQRDPWRIGGLSPAEVIESEFRDIDAANDKLYEKQVDYLKDVEVASRDTWEQVAEDRYEAQSRAYDILIDQEREQIQRASTILQTGLSSWQRGFEDFVSTGKLSFKSLVDGMISDLARLGVNRLFQVLISGTQGGGFAGLSSIFGGMFANDRGNVVKRYADGGIINRPTIFPARQGLALAGEAGAEAIMPLKRDRRGNLGVSGGAGGTVNNYYINAIDTQSFAEAAKRSGAIPGLVAEDIGKNGIARQAVLNAR